MVAMSRDTPGTLYLNAATVPRVRPLAGGRSGAKHHFCLVSIEGGRISLAEEVWVHVLDATTRNCNVVERMEMFRLARSSDGVESAQVYNNFTGDYEDVN
jgi:hypothetical protein